MSPYRPAVMNKIKGCPALMISNKSDIPAVNNLTQSLSIFRPSSTVYFSEVEKEEEAVCQSLRRDVVYQCDIG